MGIMVFLCQADKEKSPESPGLVCVGLRLIKAT
jgi:hypothetical protein